jgi:hypothetical protein
MATTVIVCSSRGRAWKNGISVVPFFHGTSALVGLSFLIVEVWRSHSDTPQSVGLLWTVIVPSLIPLPDNTYDRQTSMPQAGFEPTIPASERLQIHS